MSYFVNETAVVDANVQIGEGTKVWHFCHVSEGARIGSDCILGQNVFVGRNVAIGNGVKIQNNVSVYEGVTLGDGVFCGPSMVFTNVMNPRALVERKDEMLTTTVEEGVTFGANCTIVCGHRIGKYAFIGAGATIIGEVPDFAMMVGVPGRQIGWMSRHGTRLDLPLSGAADTTDPATGELYRLQDGIVQLVG